MIKRILVLIVALSFVVSCSESDDSGGGSTDNFDRGAMLTFLADNIIIPAYQDLDSKLLTLELSAFEFSAAPNQTNLDILRADWLDAYITWQHVEMFNIGKAEETLYHFQMNIYPANTSDIENNVASGTADLTHPNNNDAVGFPALDYLIYGLGDTDQAILDTYTTHPDAPKYHAHLNALAMQMRSITQTVLNDWTTSYRSEFIGSTANTATSATNKLVNDYIYYFEKGLRANKIGIPAGNFSVIPLPETVEALYSKEASKVLAQEALTAAIDVFNGKAYNSTTTGISYSSYLSFLNRDDLVTAINDQFQESEDKMELLSDSFYDQVNADNTKMTQTYDALQAAVVLLKVDMLQAFNISVDYIDGDGD
ncbi:MAG: peptidase M75 superfamily protein [Bacteroidetes bacterium MedPE-SWsnd-G2]|nr:MAG: peptidase M75 superfamily protein [Bacteroidetes bacterium MedPE-SWsnd-G2]